MKQKKIRLTISMGVSDDFDDAHIRSFSLMLVDCIKEDRFVRHKGWTAEMTEAELLP